MILLILMQIVALLWLSAVFSGSETGMYGMSRVKLRYRESQGETRALIMHRLLQPIGPTIITILIGNNIVAQLLANVIEQNLDWLPEGWSVVMTVLVLTPLLLLFGEFLPKYLFHRYCDTWMYQLAWGLLIIRKVLAIPVWMVRGLTAMIERLFGTPDAQIWEPHTSRPNLRTFLSADSDSNSLSSTQSELVDRILAMERITLAYGGVTKPIGSIASLDGGSSVAAARNSLGPKYFQRYLVRHHDDNTPYAYLSAVDLVISDDDVLLHDIARDIPTLAATTPLHEALHQMHASGSDLVLVSDETGNVTGVAFRGDCVRVLANLD